MCPPNAVPPLHAIRDELAAMVVNDLPGPAGVPACAWKRRPLNGEAAEVTAVWEADCIPWVRTHLSARPLARSRPP